MVSAAGLLFAACGSDAATDKGSAPPSTSPSSSASPTSSVGGSAVSSPPGADTSEPGSTGVGGSTGVDGSTAGSAAGTASAGSAGCPTIDSSGDDVHGTGAGRFMSDLECAAKSPLKAEGDPIVIGFQNPEGDPASSFPEYTLAAQAAVKYINEELGGIGSDIQNGKPGRPIQLDVCKMAFTPDDSQRCANELIAKKPALVYSSLNYFGNHFPIYAAANIPVIVGTPNTVGDFTSPNVYAVGGGGGCVGVHNALVKYTTQELKAKRVAIPWSDSPPGVTCYYDAEAKPMDVLIGKVKGDSPLAGSEPDLKYLGVPIKPSASDVTPQVTQVLDFKPDAIIYSAQGADCWNFVAALARLGWTPDSIPLVLSTACLDFNAMKAAINQAKGIYFVGSSGTIHNPPDSLSDPLAKFEAQMYQSKTAEYGLGADQSTKGFAGAGWNGMMSLWERGGDVVRSGGEVTGATLSTDYKNTENAHMFGSTPLACKLAPAPYISLCNSKTAVSQWDGTKLNSLITPYTAIDLVAGTPLRTGP